MRAHKNEQSVLSCEENSSCRTSEHHDDKMMLADGDHCRPAKKILTAVPVSLLTQPHSIQGPWDGQRSDYQAFKLRRGLRNLHLLGYWSFLRRQDRAKL